MQNRRQRVQIGQAFSEWFNVQSGIPQGSVLGPLLFIIYINDLADEIDEYSDIYIYADDNKIFSHVKETDDCRKLQANLNNLYEWTKRWLLKLNIEKCYIMSAGRSCDISFDYVIDDKKIKRTDNMKDLGVTFDTKLKFDKHMDDKINIAYVMLATIKRNFKYISPSAFVILYKSMVRSQLEYAQSVWSPYRKEYIEKLEKVQIRATKIVKGIQHLSYADRLRFLKLPTLKFRRIRGDMIELYKHLKGLYDRSSCMEFRLKGEVSVRSNSMALVKNRFKYDLRKYCFSNRVCNVWNSLPDFVVSAPTFDTFKGRLDAHWSRQDVKYNWCAELMGTGDRSHM